MTGESCSGGMHMFGQWLNYRGFVYGQYNETGFRLLPQVRLATKNKDESGATLQIQDALQHCGCIACGLQMDKYRP